MNGAEVLDVGRDAIMVLLRVSGPLVLVALATGVIIALFQAITQIQEMTLTFVPKILALFASLLILLPFMSLTLLAFMLFSAKPFTNAAKSAPVAPAAVPIAPAAPRPTLPAAGTMFMAIFSIIAVFLSGVRGVQRRSG